MSFISIKNLKYSYSDSKIKALDDVSLSIEKGEYVAILGNNGSGKSTLARLLFGFLEATEGTIKIAQSEKPIGFVQQNPKYQIIAGTVEKDTAFGPENLGIPEVEIKTRTQTCLKQVELLEKATEKTADPPVPAEKSQTDDRFAAAGSAARCRTHEVPVSESAPAGTGRYIPYSPAGSAASCGFPPLRKCG